jgi:precorrin isomerase
MQQCGSLLLRRYWFTDHQHTPSLATAPTSALLGFAPRALFDLVRLLRLPLLRPSAVTAAAGFVAAAAANPPLSRWVVL